MPESMSRREKRFSFEQAGLPSLYRSFKNAFDTVTQKKGGTNAYPNLEGCVQEAVAVTVVPIILRSAFSTNDNEPLVKPNESGILSVEPPIKQERLAKPAIETPIDQEELQSGDAREASPSTAIIEPATKQHTPIEINVHPPTPQESPNRLNNDEFALGAVVKEPATKQEPATKPETATKQETASRLTTKRATKQYTAAKPTVEAPKKKVKDKKRPPRVSKTFTRPTWTNGGTHHLTKPTPSAVLHASNANIDITTRDYGTIVPDSSTVSLRKSSSGCLEKAKGSTINMYPESASKIYCPESCNITLYTFVNVSIKNPLNCNIWVHGGGSVVSITGAVGCNVYSGEDWFLLPADEEGARLEAANERATSPLANEVVVETDGAQTGKSK